MYVIIISLFQLSVVGLPVEEEGTYEDMGDTPARPLSHRAGRFSLEPAKLSFQDELASTLRRRGLSPAISDIAPDPLVNLLVSFCKSKIPFSLCSTFSKLNTVPYIK